jgi:hypothetical protein
MQHMARHGIVASIVSETMYWRISEHGQDEIGGGIGRGWKSGAENYRGGKHLRSRCGGLGWLGGGKDA